MKDLLPQFQAEEAPQATRECTLTVDFGNDFRIIHILSLASLGSRKCIANEISALAFCPYGKGRREAHLVRAVHDLLRHIPAHGRAQNILHRSVFELDAGGNGGREFHQFPVQERDPGDSRPWAMLMRSST